MNIICPTCNREFKIKPSHAYRRRFCSRTCKRQTSEVKEIIRIARSKPPVYNTCPVCKKTFKVYPSQKKLNRNNFCSRTCWNLIFTPWNKGKKGIIVKDEILNKLRIAALDQIRGKNHPNWKGEKVSYRRMHKWVEFNRGKPKQCEHCHKIIENTRFIHWANKSHKYKRDLDDWIRLCSKCHKKYDKV